MKQILLLFYILFFGYIKAQTPLTKLTWLIGSWTYNTKTYTVTESWKQVSDTLFIGNSVTLRTTDTLAFEKLELIYRNGKLIFNSNKKTSIKPFATLVLAEDSVLFENTTNHFPQFITYKKVSAEKICISFEGMLGERLKHRKFYYDRVDK